LLEIEGEVERPAQTGIPELGAPGVERESLHDPDVADGKLLEHDAPMLDRSKVVSGRPIPRRVLDAPIELVRFERFKFNRQVAEIVEAQFSEIVLPDIDVEVPGPVI
jgi:hypothetical protein